MNEIKGFFGEHRFLSNFWQARVVLDGMLFQTTEHAYQAAKTLDMDLRRVMSFADTPAAVKKLGGTVKLRADWEDVKEDVMRDLLIQKFSIDPLMTQLLGTEDAYLEETNTWGDTYWGVCNGIGKNKLGLLLMEVRDNLREIAVK